MCGKGYSFIAGRAVNAYCPLETNLTICIKIKHTHSCNTSRPHLSIYIYINIRIFIAALFYKYHIVRYKYHIESEVIVYQLGDAGINCGIYIL